MKRQRCGSLLNYLGREIVVAGLLDGRGIPREMPRNRIWNTGAMREVEKYWVGRAMELARRAAHAGDVPVGALVVCGARGLAAGDTGGVTGDTGGVISRDTNAADFPDANNLLSKAADVPGSGTTDSSVASSYGTILGEGWNTREVDNDPAGHAEIMALRAAARALGSWRLEGCDLYVTLEPCTMCAGAIVAARVRRVIFGAWDEKAGAAGSIRDVLRDSRLNHQVEVIGGVRGEACARQLREFFGR